MDQDYYNLVNAERRQERKAISVAENRVLARRSDSLAAAHRKQDAWNALKPNHVAVFTADIINSPVY